MPKCASLLLILLFPLALFAQIWQFPGEAMDDLTRLNRENLFEKWNPKPLTIPEPEQPGEYVQYNHESLTYFFGPFPDAASAEIAQNSLREIQEILIRQDPKFNTSRIGLHHQPGAAGPATDTPLPNAETQSRDAPPDPVQDNSPPLPPEAPAETPSHPTAFWISTLIILAVTGVLLRKIQ